MGNSISSLVYRRYNIQFSQFIKKDNGDYIFEDNYRYKSLIINTTIIIKSANLKNILTIKRTDYIKIKPQKIGIKFRFTCKSNELPVNISIKNSNAEMNVHCSGSLKGIPFSKKEKDDKAPPLTLHKEPTKRYNKKAPLPNTNWSITHPFQGGSFTPK